MKMNNKLKWYPLKINGEIAKTPVYSDRLDREFCCLYLLDLSREEFSYNGRTKSLYERYKEVLSEPRNYDGQMVINKENIPTQKIIQVIQDKITKYENNAIIPKINEFNNKINHLCNIHTKSINDLNYVAARMPAIVEEYNDLSWKIKMLQDKKIRYCVNNDEYNENYHEYSDVIDDINPIESYDFKYDACVEKYV